MAKFIFPMEQLLNIKRKMEKQKQMEYAKALQELSAAEQRLQVLITVQKEEIVYYQSYLCSGTINPNEMKRLHVALQYYRHQVALQEAAVEKGKQQVQLAIEAVRKALQERKTYELLREKEYESYLEEEKLQGLKTVDEIVSYKYRES